MGCYSLPVCQFESSVGGVGTAVGALSLAAVVKSPPGGTDWKHRWRLACLDGPGKITAAVAANSLSKILRWRSTHFADYFWGPNMYQIGEKPTKKKVFPLPAPWKLHRQVRFVVPWHCY